MTESTFRGRVYPLVLFSFFGMDRSNIENTEKRSIAMLRRYYGLMIFLGLIADIVLVICFWSYSVFVEFPFASGFVVVGLLALVLYFAFWEKTHEWICEGGSANCWDGRKDSEGYFLPSRYCSVCGSRMRPIWKEARIVSHKVCQNGHIMRAARGKECNFCSICGEPVRSEVTKHWQGARK